MDISLAPFHDFNNLLARAVAATKLRELHDAQSLAYFLRQEITVGASKPGITALRDAGITHVYRYARLTWKELRDIIPNRTELEHTVIAMAHHYRCVPDMPLDEAMMRLVLRRAPNLFDVPGMQARLATPVKVILTQHLTDNEFMSLQQVTGRRWAPSAYQLHELLTNWSAIFFPQTHVPLGDNENDLMERGAQAHDAILKILPEFDLWAPIVWTEAERAKRIELGWDEEHSALKAINRARAKKKLPSI